MHAYSDTAVFVRVGEGGSFSRAAQTLMLTPSAVSKAVTRLERRLGARLLLRSTRSLRLTELGQEYFERCKEAFEQIQRADTRVSDTSMHGAGWLRLEMPASIRHGVVPPLREFLARHPGVRLELTLRDRPSDMFCGNVDAALRIGPLPPSELVASRVGELRRLTCGAPSFIQRHGEPATPTDLRPEHCLALIDTQSGRPEHWTFCRGGAASIVEPRSQLVLGDADAAVSAAVCGLGFVQVPSWSARHHIENGQLQPVLFDWHDDAPLPVYVVYPKHRQQSVVIKAFTNFLKASLPSCDLDRRSHGDLSRRQSR